jgi:hypothetical protein
MPLTIACVYADGQLSTAWFQFCRRLRVETRRAGFAGRIDLVRRSHVTDGFDVLVTMPTLFDEVSRAHGEGATGSNPTRVVSLAADDKAGLGELVKWIVAESPVASDDEGGRSIAVHHGFQMIGSRVVPGPFDGASR